MAQVVSHLHLREQLRGGVIGFSFRFRIVADAVETRRAAAIKDQTGIERPTRVTQPAVLELKVELTLDALLEARKPATTACLRGVLEQAEMPAITK